jgi:excisionase family DNA binding protein
LPVKEFYRPDEAAAVLNVSKKTIYRLIKDEKLKAVRIRSILRISRIEIDRISRHKKSSRRR